MSGVELTLQDLAQAVGVPERTIRYYIAEGLLPAPNGRGKAASYGEEHLLRLRLVRKLSERRVPLAEQRVQQLALDQVQELLQQEEQLEAERRRVQGAVSPKEYIGTLLREARARRLPEPAAPPAKPALGPTISAPAGKTAESWRRWELAPGLELHVRAQDVAHYQQVIEQVLRIAADQIKPRGGDQSQEDMV